MSQGVFLVVEGTDGSGKGTQFELLTKRLKQAGYEVATFDFPQYDEPSSYFVKQYLNGKYGTADEVGPYTGSLFYALDRYQAAPQIRKALNEGKVVLANRFTGSNMAHQGGKFANVEERRGFFIWADNLEFQLLQIPRPAKSFVLRVPGDVAQELVDKKEKRSYTSKKRDLHEADLKHLERSVETFDDLCALFPKDFEAINCVKNNKLQTVEAINDLLWEAIKPLLTRSDKVKLTKKEAAAMAEQPTAHVQVENPYIRKIEDGQWEITEEGRQYLDAGVTDSEGDVYAFTDKIPAETIAAAMARLSRSPDDMRVTILNEFAGKADKDEQLLDRVITAYGDDSVQQLVGQSVVVEGASNLLTKQLEWGRLASYLEQSTRYIYFDQKDENGKFKYFTPEQFPADVAERYEAVMDQIFEKYSSMVHELTLYIQQNDSTPKENQDGPWRAATRAQACDAIRYVLPVATKSTVGIFASGQALESMIMRLQASDSVEARGVGDAVLRETRKVIPTFLKRADLPDRGAATVAYLANTRHAVGELAMQFLPIEHSVATEAVSLSDVVPANELDLVPHMLYEHSNASLEEIRAQVDTWTIEQKQDVFDAYMGERLNRRHRPGRALEHARYTWDLVCDYGIFRDLQRHRMVDDLEWQPLTPRFGYEVPALVEEAGLSDEYEACFDLAAELYSELQAAGYPYEAQYATLLGHRMRWTVTYNAREAFHLHEIRTSPQGHAGYRKLVLEMHDRLAEKHPGLADAMKFVNKGEDPELARLASERATAFKLQQLDKK